jgi:hypothetical protein
MFKKLAHICDQRIVHSWTYVVDFFFNRENLWDNVKKSAKQFTGKKIRKNVQTHFKSPGPHKLSFLAKLHHLPKWAKDDIFQPQASVRQPRRLLMERLSAATLCSSINTVLEAFQKARQRLGRSSFAGLHKNVVLTHVYFVSSVPYCRAKSEKRA